MTGVLGFLFAFLHLFIHVSVCVPFFFSIISTILSVAIGLVSDASVLFCVALDVCITLVLSHHPLNLLPGSIQGLLYATNEENKLLSKSG